MAQSRKVPQAKTKLEVENQRLKAENLKLKAKLTTQSPKKPVAWRVVGMWISATLASALLITGVLFFWIGNTLVNTDKYVATVGPVIQQQSVQTAISSYTTEKVFTSYDVQGFVTDVLPPRADFLAPQLTKQLHTGIQTGFSKVLASQKFQETWATIQRNNHQRIINFVKNYQGDGNIQLSDVFDKLTASLGDSKLSFLQKVKLPAKIGSIQIIDATWLPTAHNIVVNLPLYQFLVTSMFIILTGLAVWLAHRKRRMVIAVSITFSMTLLANLIAVRIFKTLLVSQVAAEYQQAARDTANIILHPYVQLLYSLLLVTVLSMVVAWMSGPYKSAVAFRSRLEKLLSGNIHQSIFGNRENAVTKWFGRHKRQLQWASLLLVTGLLLILQISLRAVALYALLLIILMVVIECVAVPSQKS